MNKDGVASHLAVSFPSRPVACTRRHTTRSDGSFPMPILNWTIFNFVESTMTSLRVVNQYGCISSAHLRSVLWDVTGLSPMGVRNWPSKHSKTLTSLSLDKSGEPGGIWGAVFLPTCQNYHRWTLKLELLGGSCDQGVQFQVNGRLYNLQILPLIKRPKRITHPHP